MCSNRAAFLSLLDPCRCVAGMIMSTLCQDFIQHEEYDMKLRQAGRASMRNQVHRDASAFALGAAVGFLGVYLIVDLDNLNVSLSLAGSLLVLWYVHPYSAYHAAWSTAWAVFASGLRTPLILLLLGSFPTMHCMATLWKGADVLGQAWGCYLTCGWGGGKERVVNIVVLLSVMVDKLP